ncbi:hypothetical protein [Streptomyces sp. NPDC015130]|uniref:hypothetical protein n=1 Tax=Streptomyces sp. NPDC015130 TaxID=3364940 RepID=UPI0036F56161
MSNDLRPRAASPVPVAPPDAERARLRRLSMIGAGLFFPASLLAGILVLTRENTARCLTYGERCNAAPGSLYAAALVLFVVAWMIVQSAARPDVRRAALWTQIGAECVFLLFLLTAFA